MFLKTINKTILSLAGILSFCHSVSFAQNFYSIDTIQKIEISFSQPNWDYILDTAKQGTDSYSMASWVKINGVMFDSAGVKYKGNSSYNPNNAKNPLHIELDHFKNQDYLGYKDIKLSNGYHEPSLLREVLSYSLLQKYMKASVANFAQVYINGEYFGLYSNVEAVTNTFVENRFFSNDNSFFFADNGGCDLRFKGPDTNLYNSPYTKKSVYGLADLAALCSTLKNNISGIESILDVDRTLWMLSFTNALVILDSYLGNSKHNYYLYEDHLGRFNPIIWDLNGGFGIFNKIDNGVGLSVPQMKTLSPMLHSNDSMWPLVKNILSVPRYKKMYIAHMRTIVNENFSDSSYINEALHLRSVIDTAVQSDTKSFYSYSQFISNLDSNVIDGPKTIPGITSLMGARVSFLYSSPEFQQVPPSVTNIQPSDSFPAINSDIFIKADVSNGVVVFLGIRSSVMEKFTRMPMFDDGLHGDGAAGDGTFGISVSVSSPEIQYYVYAENNNAGIFSPERAEHEWYTVVSDYSTIASGEVVINEIMAVNSSTVQSASGLFSDWVELYNASTDTLYLDNLNLSDDPANTSKWEFPPGLSIAPNSFLVVWADGDSATGELHCSFKFSGGGEKAVLSYANGYVVDSLSFPVQSADISYGRFPNGTGPFVFMPPTFNAVNSLTSIENRPDQSRLRIYPNPSSGEFTLDVISGETGGTHELYLMNPLGEIVFEKTGIREHETLNLHLRNGIYFLQLKNGKGIFTKKIIIRN